MGVIIQNSSPLSTEFQYYRNHQAELVAQYEGKYIVIVGEEVMGAYATMEEAYQTAMSRFKAGEFLIQHCLAGKDSFTQTFHHRVRV